MERIHQPLWRRNNEFVWGHEKRFSERGHTGTGSSRTCALLTEKGRVYQAEGTAKAKARRQEHGSLLYIPVAEAALGRSGEMSGVARQPEGCPLPVLCPEFVTGEIKGKGRSQAQAWPQPSNL